MMNHETCFSSYLEKKSANAVRKKQVDSAILCKSKRVSGYINQLLSIKNI